MTKSTGFWGPLTNSNFTFVVIIFFIAGICFGIAIGLKMSKINQDDIRADIELIKSETELAEALDRVLRTYNEQLRRVMDNYQKALDILKKEGVN